MVIPTELDTDDHEVDLAGAWPIITSPSAGPTLLERRDEDFVEAFLEELRHPQPEEVLRSQRLTASAGSVLRLFQPVHRVFNLALLEVRCRTFGDPRLDPRKIESAGLVLRRLAPASDQNPVSYEGWMSRNGQVQGWTQISADEADLDPDPRRRRAMRVTPDPWVDLQALGGPSPMAEDHARLFVAPPDTARATGRTLLYGVLPLTSSAQAGEPAPGAAPTDEEWGRHLNLLLKASSSQPPFGVPNTGNWEAGDLRQYADAELVRLIRQLAQEFRLFEPEPGPEARRVIALLNELPVTGSDNSVWGMGDYLGAVVRFLRGVESPGQAVPRPKAWSGMDAARATAVATGLRLVAAEVRRTTVAPLAGKFEDTTRRYAARAFIRVRCPNDCPPKIVWSAYSEPFEIAAWYETGPTKPVVVSLPDPFDRNFLSRAKPGVAFSVPARLANFVNQDPRKLLDGSANGGSGVALDWICGFSIPIVTICAFIVLSIFLSLLDLFLRWMLFVKVCIPFPRKK